MTQSNQDVFIRPMVVADYRYFKLRPIAQACVAVVLVAKRPIGYAFACPVPGLSHILELYAYIEPAYRRRGFGTTLVRYIAMHRQSDEAREFSVSLAENNNAAEKFLEKRGYSIEHVEYKLILEKLQRTENLKLVLFELAPTQAIPLFVRLYAEAFSGYPWYQPYEAEEVYAEWSSGHHIFFMASDGIVFGFVWARLAADGVAELEPVGIVKGYQDRGLGHLILRSVINKLSQMKVQKIVTTTWKTNERALALFESFGFARVSARLYYSRPIVSQTPEIAPVAPDTVV